MKSGEQRHDLGVTSHCLIWSGCAMSRSVLYISSGVAHLRMKPWCCPIGTFVPHGTKPAPCLSRQV